MEDRCTFDVRADIIARKLLKHGLILVTGFALAKWTAGHFHQAISEESWLPLFDPFLGVAIVVLLAGVLIILVRTPVSVTLDAIGIVAKRVFSRVDAKWKDITKIVVRRRLTGEIIQIFICRETERQEFFVMALADMNGFLEILRQRLPATTTFDDPRSDAAIENRIPNSSPR